MGFPKREWPHYDGGMEVIDQRRRDLGGFEVGRVLPFTRRHMVGPFIFFDHIGPVTFAPGGVGPAAAGRP